jgi:hypothetical protein
MSNKKPLQEYKGFSSLRKMHKLESSKVCCEYFLYVKLLLPVSYLYDPAKYLLFK